jgi:hypothetical protein
MLGYIIFGYRFTCCMNIAVNTLGYITIAIVNSGKFLILSSTPCATIARILLDGVKIICLFIMYPLLKMKVHMPTAAYY